MKRDYGIYHVALKVLLKKGNSFLFLRTDSGKLDLPGGRIDNVEAETPLAKILAREIREELGSKIRYKVNRPIFQYRGYFAPRKIYIFMTVYDGLYISGDIMVSAEHASYEWIDPKMRRLQNKDFFNNEEYQAFKNYFMSVA